MAKESQPALRRPFEATFRRNSETPVVTTEELSEMWRDHFGTSVRVNVGEGSSRLGGLRRGTLGTASLSVLRAGPHTVTAKPSPAHAHVHFLLVVSGSAVLAQDGRRAEVPRQGLVCLDSSRRFGLTVPEKSSIVAIRVPHSVLRVRAADTARVTALPWSREPGLVKVVGEALAGFGQYAGDLDDDIAGLIGASFVNLLAMLIRQHRDTEAHDSAASREALLEEVMRYCLEHLDDVDLTPRAVARAHHMSIRRLQQLFAERGTSPARWIRAERLARCHDDLRNPAKRHLSVATIGERWGLLNASHFSRQFRGQYGVTPSELRNLLLAGAA